MESAESQREITFETRPPTIEWHIGRLPQEFDLMTVWKSFIQRSFKMPKKLYFNNTFFVKILAGGNDLVSA